MWSGTGESRSVALLLLDGSSMRAESSVDFEDALGGLRRELDERELVLACNRFRRDAVTTDELRAASDGLACYVVRQGHTPSADDVVDALGDAPVVETVPARDNVAHIRNWILQGRTQQVHQRARRPLPHVVEYILWVIDELPPVVADRLAVTSAATKSTGPTEPVWQREIERALKIGTRERTALRGMWAQTQAATSAVDVAIPARAWARHVVATNFTGSRR